MGTITEASVEAWTIKRIASEMDVVRQRLGKRAYICFGISPLGKATLGVYPDDVARSDTRESFISDSFSGLFCDVHAWIDRRETVRREHAIRAMALAIIDLTDRDGACTETALVRRGFARDEIAALRQAACERAEEMAGNTPFVVETR